VTRRQLMMSRRTASVLDSRAVDGPDTWTYGWPTRIVRVAGAGILITTGAIHLDLYVTGYRAIPTIGWLFLLQVIAGFGLGVGVLATPTRRILTRRLVAAAGAGFALATLVGYLLSVWIGLFGFREVSTTAGIVAGVVEIAGFAVLAALAIGPPAGRSAVTMPTGGAAATQLRFPRLISLSFVRAGAATVAALSVAGLVLLAVAEAADGPPPIAATGGLTTVRIGGATVLANGKRFTVYSFAPDTPTTSMCDASCAAYWPPVIGTAAVNAGLPGPIRTIIRTDGSHQLTYDGHPLYTYIADNAPGQNKGNNLNLNGGRWHDLPVSQ
jgi:predicted lipoprotein with Yx(FWY)xxD motif